MTTCNVLATLHEAGLVLAQNPAGGLAVGPASRITPELRIVIKTNRDGLLAQLSHEASNDAIGAQRHADLDRYCWPHSNAMNGQEIETFKARLVRFTDKGLCPETAEREADRLVARDREGDDRRLCLECAQLQGTGRWRCGNWMAAEVAREGVAPELVRTLQRCFGYWPVTNDGL